MIEGGKDFYVYVIGSSDSPLKIGVTSDIPSRLSSLRTSSPFDLKVLFAVRLAHDVVRYVESEAHRILHERRVRAEWFCCDQETAIAAVKRAANSVFDCALAGLHDDLAPVQCRMARAGLGMSQEDLAAAVGVSDRTILLFEKSGRLSRPARMAIRAALEAKGARFTETSDELGVLIKAGEGPIYATA